MLMLDDLDKIKDIDKSDMLGLLDQLPDQIEVSVNNAKKVNLTGLAGFKPTSVLVAGMGGSAISGDILRCWLAQRDNIIIETVRNYSLPNHAKQNTLVFACSYSGNTEETLSAVQNALENGCKIISVTSGGKLKEFSIENNIPIVEMPQGLAPRAAVAFLLFPMIAVLEKMKIIKPFIELPDIINDLKTKRGTIKSTMPIEQNPAKQIAAILSRGIPFIYGHSYLNVIAYRWKTQLNENAKVLAMSGELPEMNHNELVGWFGDNQTVAKKFIVILLRSHDEEPRIIKRLELTKKMLKAIVSEVLEVESKGEDRLARMLTTMYLGDYVSVYLAIIRELDPTPVVPIEHFKKLMDK